MYIPTSPRPCFSPVQQNPQHVIDELLAAYQNDKQQQKPDPAAALILWIKNSIYDDGLRNAYAEQAESARAVLFRQLTTIFINENVDDDEVWNEISRGWDEVPSTDHAPVLCDIVQVLGVPNPAQQQLWQWVWREAKNINAPFNSSALLLQITESLVANDQYGMLYKILDAELTQIAYAERYFLSEKHALNPSRIGASFWPSLLYVIKQIPKQDTFLLSILNCAGALFNKLEIDNLAIWKVFLSILIPIKKLGTEDIEKFINIGRQYSKDPEFWEWMIAFIPTINIRD